MRLPGSERIACVDGSVELSVLLQQAGEGQEAAAIAGPAQKVAARREHWRGRGEDSWQFHKLLPGEPSRVSDRIVLRKIRSLTRPGSLSRCRRIRSNTS